MPVDDEDIVFRDIGLRLFAGHSARELALNRIVFQKVCEVVRGDEIVDGDHIERLAEQALFDEGPKHEPTDATETVNADFHHDNILLQ